MAHFALFRSRQIRLPTLWGWIAIVLSISLILAVTVRYLGVFLSLNQPVGEGVLVVEGWLEDEQLDRVLSIFERGNYEFLVTSGGPVSDCRGDSSTTYAESAAQHLIKRKFPPSKLGVAPAPASIQDRTFLGAVMVREWLASSGREVKWLDVVSGGAHARRSRALYQRAFGETVHVGVISLAPQYYELRHWWRTSEGAKSVVSEVAGLLWMVCCFDPGEPGSHQEKWAEEEP